VRRDLQQAKYTIPAGPERALERERLVAMFPDAGGAQYAPVTIVSAPTGAGKTALVAAAAGAFTPAAAWCTLDQGDNDPHSFGRSVLEAVLAARSIVELGQAAVAIAAAADPLDEALRIASHGPALMLVLDDCEHLQPSATHATVGRLIRQLPPNLALVLVANQDVDLPARLRAATRVRELRAADIAFSIADVRDLFAQAGVAVQDSTIESLVAWTEGLPSSIRLAVAVASDADDPDDVLARVQLSESAAHLALFTLVFAMLPREARTFLTETAIAEPLCGELARAITEDPNAPARLVELAAHDLFLDPLPGCPNWYRYRGLKRQLLLADLRHTNPGAVPRLHARAARWLDADGSSDAALEHALSGDDWDLVSRIVRARWISATLRDADTELHHVPRMPPAIAADSFDRALVASLIELEHGDDVSARAMLIRLEFEDRSDDGADFVEPLLALRLARADMDPDRIERFANDVMKRFAEPGPSAADLDHALALASRALAEADLLRGDLPNATRVLEQVIDDGLQRGLDAPVFDATASLALVTALAGRPRRAAALADELGESWNGRARRANGVRSLLNAICAYHADALPAAQDAASEARRDLPAGVYGDIVLPIVRARIAASVGDTDAARRLLERAASTGHHELVWTLRDAFGLSEPQWDANVRTGSDAVTHPHALALAGLRQAVVHFDRNETQAALASLDTVLGLVERNEFRRIFLDSGLRVRPVLLAYIKDGRPFGHAAWQVLHRLPGEEAEVRGAIVETLTERELTVLRYLPTMMSNREIAAEMYFSVNTVKTHLKSIYRKLGVSRRRDAVTRARALSLL
jgi:LuxR family maltose regulon positive regulatory protein